MLRPEDWDSTNPRRGHMPRIEIDLAALTHNAVKLSRDYAAKGISLSAVTKGVCGDPKIAMALWRGGIRTFADSRLDNIERMRRAGVPGPFMLIRPPILGEAERVVRMADVSFNTELVTIRRLAWEAERLGRQHGIILMVEMGELREGILPRNLASIVRETLQLASLDLRGIGTNWVCLNEIRPTQARMKQFAVLCRDMEKRFGLDLEIVSGGNSANHYWAMEGDTLEPVNHLRLGEALLLGRETTRGDEIAGLETHAFTLVSEIIEAKRKSYDWHEDQGLASTEAVAPRRIIVALGEQDVPRDGVRPRAPAFVTGACSDQMVLTSRDPGLSVGNEVCFDLNYAGLVRAMTSPFVRKLYLEPNVRYDSAIKAASSVPLAFSDMAPVSLSSARH